MTRIPVAPLVKFGIFALVTTLATVVLGMTIANAQSGDRTTYSARFTDVAGLLPGDDVRIAGVVVGSVKDIEVVDHNAAQVDFEVESSLRLPGSTTASVLYKNLIGQRMLALGQQPGCDPAAPATIAAGGLITTPCTKPPLNLTQLFNGFQPLFTALDPQQINTLSNEIVQVLQGQGGTIDSLLASVASLTSTIADRDKVIGQVIDNLNGALDSVTSRNDELNDLIVSLRELVSGLAQDREPIGNAISSIGELTNVTAGLLEDGRPALKADIAALGDLADQLNQAEPVIEHYLQFAPYKLNKIARAGSYGSWFNFYLCGVSGTIGLGDALPPIKINLPDIGGERCGADPDGMGDDLANGPPWPVPGAEYGDGSSGHDDKHSDHGDAQQASTPDILKDPESVPAIPVLGGS